MIYDVLLLRRNGERLKKTDREPPLRGTVRITEMDRDTNNFKRNLVRIDLWQQHGSTSMRGLAHMSDPVLLPYNGEGLLIAGIELEVSNKGAIIKEHRQVWLCTPAAGSEAEWARELYERTKRRE